MVPTGSKKINSNSELITSNTLLLILIIVLIYLLILNCSNLYLVIKITATSIQIFNVDS